MTNASSSYPWQLLVIGFCVFKLIGEVVINTFYTYHKIQQQKFVSLALSKCVEEWAYTDPTSIIQVREYDDLIQELHADYWSVVTQAIDDEIQRLYTFGENEDDNDDDDDIPF